MRNHARTRTEQAYRAQAGSMVFAVWRSASELDGVGVLVIKGQAYLSAIITDNQPLPRDSCVIECETEACSLRAVILAGRAITRARGAVTHLREHRRPALSHTGEAWPPAGCLSQLGIG